MDCQKGKKEKNLQVLEMSFSCFKPFGVCGVTKPQYKSKPNTELSKPNTEHRGVYQKKKKKIPNTQTKIKPSKPLTHGRSHRRRHRRSELVVVIVVRLVAPHRRSEIRERRSLCLCSGARRSPLSAPSDPPSRYFALFSL